MIELLRRARRRGARVEGNVAYCADPNLVSFPGAYATKRNRKGDEVPDPKVPVRWVNDLSVDGNGFWEYV